jgi:hypothetical protein
MIQTQGIYHPDPFITLKPLEPNSIENKIKYFLENLVHQNIDNKSTILYANCNIERVLDIEIKNGNITDHQTYIRILKRSTYDFNFYLHIKTYDIYHNKISKYNFMFDNYNGIKII